MGWVLRLVEIGVDGSGRSIDVMEISRPGDLGDIADLGLTLAQGKQLVALVQQEIVAAQSRDHAAQRPMCRSCGAVCQVKDYRTYVAAATKWSARTSSSPPRPPSAGLGPRRPYGRLRKGGNVELWLPFRMVKVADRRSRPHILASIARVGDTSHEQSHAGHLVAAA